MLGSAGVVADFSLHRTSTFQDLQVLVGAQQCSALLELWQIVPYTTDLPSRTCKSWQEPNRDQHRWSYGRLFLTPHIYHLGLTGSSRSSAVLSSAAAVPDYSLHRTSAIQDLQVLVGTQQRSAPLELWQIVPYITDLPSRTCRSWQELSSAQQRWSYGRFLLKPHIYLSRPSSPGRSSIVISTVGAMVDCSLHRTSSIQDLQVLAGA